MKNKEIFNKIKKVEDFAEGCYNKDKLELGHIKNELLEVIPLAIFFTCCENNEVTYEESLILINALANYSFKYSGKRLFHNIENKERLISVWNIMKKYYTHKLEIIFYQKDKMILNSPMFSDEPFEMAVKIKRTDEEKLKYAIERYFAQLKLQNYSVPYGPKQISNDEKNFNLPLGVDEKNKMFHIDLNTAKHLLLAGMPRSGKTICLHNFLISLLVKNSYNNMKLVLVDLTQVAFKEYNGLPHLAMPILTDSKSAVAGLKWITKEIDKRRKAFNEMGISNISDYEKLMQEDNSLSKISNIVIVIDEYYPLIVDYKDATINALSEIIQRGADVGIHLILSTTRPTKDNIFGTLKAYIPTRIAFRVALDIDSEVIIDKKGAECLKGKGELLLKTKDAYLHLQGFYIDDEDIIKVCNYIKENYSCEYLLKQNELDSIEVKEPLKNDIDEKVLFDVALFCIENETTNINSVQIKFSFGFNYTLEIFKELEKRGIVSPKENMKGRTILVDKDKLKKLIILP